MKFLKCRHAVLVIVLLLAFPSSAKAESLRTVLDEIDDGVYVGASRDDIDEVALIQEVERVRSENPARKLIVIAPDEPEPSASGFARRLHEETGSMVLLFPKDGSAVSYAKDKTSSKNSEINLLWENQSCALEKARGEADVVAAVGVFVEHLDSGCTLQIPKFLIFILFIILLLVGGLGVLVIKERDYKQGKVKKASEVVVS